VREEAGFPDTSSEYADEGTAAHELAALCLNEGLNATAYLGRIIKVLSRDKQTSSSWEVTEEMADYVQEYVDAITSKTKGGGVLMVEQRVDFSVYSGEPDSFGTSDAIVVFPDRKELNVDDLKYGRGVRVDAGDNEQLMLYALGAYELVNLFYDIETVRLTIHQPRLQHTSEHVISLADLLDFGSCVKPAAVAATDVDAPLNPGAKQCHWCKAKATCPALRDFIFDTVFDDFDIITDEVTVATVAPPPEDNALLAKQFALLDLVGKWAEAVGGEAKARLLAGEHLPGYKLVDGKKGNRAWLDKAEAEAALKAMRYKQAEMYSFELISPTKAEKLIKAKSPKRWAKVLPLITQSDGKPHIALESDKRPAYVAPLPADDFEDESLTDLPVLF
jgi:hypothetical protein